MKIKIFTAVFGSYEESLPDVHCESSLRAEQLCFTDSPALASPPWIVQAVPSYFQDSKLNSGYFKIHPHLLFPDDEIAVWIDGNLRNVVITEEFLLAALATSPLAAPKHIVRNNISEEAEICIKDQLDLPGKIEGHLNRLQDAELDKAEGLSATMFLVFDLRSPKVRHVNETWWKLVVFGSRRDQLSFNAACRMHDVLPTPIMVDWRKPNAIFSRVEHGKASHQIRSTHSHGAGASAFAALNLPGSRAVYFPETLTRDEVGLIRDLNACVRSFGDRLPGGPCFLAGETPSEYALFDARLSWRREFLRRSFIGAKSIVELGLGAGHAAALLLLQSKSSSLLAVDRGSNAYSRACAEILTARFPGRFSVAWKDSLESLSGVGFDAVHLRSEADFRKGFDWTLREAASGARLLVEHARRTSVDGILTAAMDQGALRELEPNLVSGGHCRLFVKVGERNCMDEIVENLKAADFDETKLLRSRMEELVHQKEQAEAKAAQWRSVATNKDREIVQRKQELAQRDQTLATITASRAWKIIQIWIAVRDRALPHGSTRRRAFKQAGDAFLRLVQNPQSLDNWSKPIVPRPKEPMDEYDRRIEELAARNPGQLSFNEYRYVKDQLRAKGKCRLLVFGLGNDSDLWAHINHGGETLFVEDSPEWIAQVKERAEELLQIEQVNYTVHLADWPQHLLHPEMLGLPPFREEGWDAIFIDGPLGWNVREHHGRMQSLCWASIFAAHRCGGNTDVFVHDFDRPAERTAAWRFFGRSRLIGTLDRLAHFRAPGYRRLEPAAGECVRLGARDARFFRRALARHKRRGALRIESFEVIRTVKDMLLR